VTVRLIGFALAVVEQVGDDLSGGRDGEAAHDRPVLAGKVRPDADPHVVAAQPPPGLRVELVHVGQQVPQTQGRGGRAVTHYGVRHSKPLRSRRPCAELEPRRPERVQVRIRRAAGKPIDPCSRLDPFEGAVLNQTAEVEPRYP